MYCVTDPVKCINKYHPQERDRSRVIFEKGCLQSGEEWAEKNLLPLAGFVLAVAFAQVCCYVFEFWEGKILSTTTFLFLIFKLKKYSILKKHK